VKEGVILGSVVGSLPSKRAKLTEGDVSTSSVDKFNCEKCETLNKNFENVNGHILCSDCYQLWVEYRDASSVDGTVAEYPEIKELNLEGEEDEKEPKCEHCKEPKGYLRHIRGFNLCMDCYKPWSSACRETLLIDPSSESYSKEKENKPEQDTRLCQECKAPTTETERFYGLLLCPKCRGRMVDVFFEAVKKTH
jgi:hypothetical protein